MKFTLQNLGRLQEATIDLGKDIILLAGPNNTSKTYVAHVIYGLCRHLRSDVLSFVMNSLQEFTTGQVEIEENFEIDLNKFFSNIFPQLLMKLSNQLQERLDDILASRKNFVTQTRVNLEATKEETEFLLRALLAVEKNRRKIESPSATILVTKKAGSSMWSFRHIPNPFQSSLPPPSLRSEKQTAWLLSTYTYIAGRLGGTLFRSLGTPYALTAERAAIQIFSRELSHGRIALVDELLAIRSGINQWLDRDEELPDVLGQRARQYPLAIRESLLYANDLVKLGERRSPFAHLADWMEHEVLGGNIQIDENGELLFQPVSSDSRLGLHLSSSSVKSLSGLSFYLRHVADRGQFLIIDEPELNLHPDNQRRVARVLARIARSGVKVLMTTHSDYIIREINNLIMLSADKEGTLRERLGYSEEETLSPEQVGAYLFDASRAHPIEVKPTGIEVETIDREINALNSVSQDIYFSLFNKDDA